MGRFRPNDRYDRTNRCDLPWEDLYHTTTSGNLSQYLKPQHVGHSWRPCPYSTQAVLVLGPEYAGYEDTYGPVDTYLYIKKMLDVETPPALVDHTLPNGKIVYLRNAHRGGWGFECTFPGCPYYLANNRRYFYI